MYDAHFLNSFHICDKQNQHWDVAEQGMRNKSKCLYKSQHPNRKLSWSTNFYHSMVCNTQETKCHWLKGKGYYCKAGLFKWSAEPWMYLYEQESPYRHIQWKQIIDNNSDLHQQHKRGFVPLVAKQGCLNFFSADASWRWTSRIRPQTVIQKLEYKASRKSS